MDWSNLSSCCEFIKDGTHGSPVRTSNGVPVLSATNVIDGRLNFETERFTTEEELHLFRKRLHPQKGDVLLTIVGTIGRAAIVVNDKPVVFQRSVCVFRPKKQRLDSAYLRRVLESSIVKSQLEHETHQVAQAGVYLESLNDIEIPLPPLPEQQRIAAILGRADRLRRTRRYAAQLSDSFLQAVFVEMFGDPARNEKGWDVCELQELIRDGDTINYGVVQPGDDVPNGAPIIRVGDLDNLSFTTANLKRIDPAIEATYKRSRLVGDEVLIACVGSIGKIALAHEGLKGFNIVRAVARVPVNGSLNRLFLATYLSTKYIQDYFKQETRTVSQPTLNILQIQETRVILPPLVLQEKFARIVRQFDRLRAQQREAERQAEHLFQALLHRAFAGE